MADVSVSYKGSVITELDDAGSKTLKTSGCYCEGDVTVKYTPRVDDSFRRWDVYLSGEILGTSFHYCTVVTDDWLKEHRNDENLCIALIPKFTIEPDSNGVNGNQGVWLCTNSPMMRDTAGQLYYSLSAYIHRTGAPTARSRTRTLTIGDNVGDFQLTSLGELRVCAVENYPLIPGQYCVMAFLM